MSAPAVSVVYVTHGRLDWLERSAAALAEHTSAPYEVVCVDNATPGAADALPALLPGARLVLNERNEGFGVACNQGAAAALAPAVVFLNTDALPTAGWLEPLLGALSVPDVGAASPAILELDGTLQDAGTLVARDGRTHPYRRGTAPDDPAHAFPREIDYANGACMAVRRSAFMAAGGFDALYSPAYFEDIDLCFALRRAGWRSVHVPASKVVHARGASSDPAAAQAIAERNLPRFRHRFRGDLATRPQWFGELSEWDVVGSRDALAPSRVLMLLDGGWSAERVALVRAIRERCPRDRLTCVAAEPHAELTAAGAEVVALAPDGLPGWLQARRRHYDAVIASPSLLAGAVAESQPAAHTLREQDALRGPLPAVLARLGVLSSRPA